MTKKRESAFTKGMRRHKKAESLVGMKGVAKQNARHARGRVKAVAKGISKGRLTTEINKHNTREAVKRVGEYKEAARRKRGDYVTKKKK